MTASSSAGWLPMSMSLPRSRASRSCRSSVPPAALRNIPSVVGPRWRRTASSSCRRGRRPLAWLKNQAVARTRALPQTWLPKRHKGSGTRSRFWGCRVQYPVPAAAGDTQALSRAARGRAGDPVCRLAYLDGPGQRVVLPTEGCQGLPKERPAAAGARLPWRLGSGRGAPQGKRARAAPSSCCWCCSHCCSLLLQRKTE